MRHRISFLVVGVIVAAVTACEPAPPPPEDCTDSGGPGVDVLTGTPGDDVLCGFGGNDRLIGLGGNDILVGGPGDDRINPGPGNDTVFGEDGEDDVDSWLANLPPSGNLNDNSDKFGNDTVVLGAGDDRVQSGEGDDVIYDGAGYDIVETEGDDDQIYQSAPSGLDLYEGGTGNDYFEGHPESDGQLQMIGGDGDDVFMAMAPLSVARALGGDGSDLAVIIDGIGLDLFQAEEEPVVPIILGPQCVVSAGPEVAEISCGLLDSSFSAGSDGSFSMSASHAQVSTNVKAIWQSGGVDIDTVYRDFINIPGYILYQDLIQ